ncbi:Rap1a/Tai family immunity protein [Sphingopyxis sp. RIFCSPHIGHO2_12_FULL_65_19]|uniref:Rap1a/Tai family immunity protein n=1 Tax=Sphingopyxis sp. RIFCSPHIGHO2_12_FULL_65_19 TaxID=1802172 RepID=UPI0025E85B49|nr:Rap1a/Tai family immunity protein [Sphingopyxis sp. RIFCSPHIGHO2_12_FULL_65_19]
MSILTRATMLAAALLVLPSSAHAEATGREFLQNIDKGGESAEVYKLALFAYSTGIGWAHSAMTNDGAAPAYCVPDTLSITADQVLSMVREAVKAQPELKELPAGLVVWAAYLYTFPCRP